MRYHGKEINVSELDANEVLEIEGGSEREGEKNTNWLESIWNYLKP
ncbi:MULTISPECIES: hypothetical protein [Sphingobacterium]|nr:MULTISPECIES: hypothetical protein [Sphingobacterium]